MEARDRKFAGSVFSTGSALILTVVLTSMLAIVGVLFVMMARVDKIATSAISENRELSLAIETVIAKISQQLVSDVPGVVLVPRQEYYDYPDVSNAWLASLEPVLDDMNTPDPSDDIYYWRQISDITGFLATRAFQVRDVDVDPPGQRRYILDYPEIFLDINGELLDQLADADGDGIADSKWVELSDITSNKGKPIYAAIRVVDLNAMLNVNTAFKFDPSDPCASHIDGSSQMQINLAGLARPVDDVIEIDAARCIIPVSTSNDWKGFQDNMIWLIDAQAPGYLPFDISDELELRYRSCLTSLGQTRLESVWYDTIGDLNDFQSVPYDGYRSLTVHPKKWRRLEDWKKRVTEHPDACEPDRCHLLTTYNIDRTIDPNGDKMININRETSPRKIYDRLLRSSLPLIPTAFTRRQYAQQYAQLAVNIVDFADNDPNVTTLVDPNGVVYYGFDAQPFITEVAWKIHQLPESGLNYYALELYNPFNEIIDLNNVTSQECFELELYDRVSGGPPIRIGFRPFDRINPGSYFVIANYLSFFAICPYDPNCRTNVKQDTRLNFFGSWKLPDKSKPVEDRRADPDKGKPPIYIGWTNNYDVFLKRRVFVPALAGTPMEWQWIYVDKWLIEPDLAQPGEDRFFGRTQNDWHVVYQTPITIEISPYRAGVGRLGTWNGISSSLFPEHNFSFFMPNPLNPVQEFITVGDIPRILTLGHGTEPNSTIGEQLLLYYNEADVRLDLANPYHRNVFQYLTVFDPNSDGIDNDADGLIDAADTISPEVQIPGRININTAPWYVIAQLPWVTNEIAQAIVAYRDKLALVLGVVDYSTSLWPPPDDVKTRKYGMDLQQIDPDVREEPGFASIGELLNVTHHLSGTVTRQYNPLYDVRTLGREVPANDLPGFPDLTTDGPGLGDGIDNDFEERDVIFSRISNLVTVRSDVFTAYILVRIGADGPQKRVIAILDRSGVNKTNVASPYGKVRIVALHYVPDPR